MKLKNKNPNGGRKFKKETFMNDKLKKLIFFLVVIIIILFTTLAIVVTSHRTKQPVPPQKTIIISDTITQVIYDTVYIKEYKTVKFPITDTLYIDSVKIDSIFVEVPISVYQLDTTFTTDTTRLDLFIQNSGYDVKLDSLYYRLQYTPTPPKLPKKKHRFGFYVGPSVGVGYDWTTGKTLPSVGVGIGVGFSVGKY